jgi:hypothetical protein
MIVPHRQGHLGGIVAPSRTADELGIRRNDDQHLFHLFPSSESVPGILDVFRPHSASLKSESRQTLFGFYQISIDSIVKEVEFKYPLNPKELDLLSSLKRSDAGVSNIQKVLEDVNATHMWIRVLLHLSSDHPKILCRVLPSLYSSSVMPPEGCTDVIICAYYRLALMGLDSASIPECFYQMLLRMVPKLGLELLYCLPNYALVQKCPSHLQRALNNIMYDFGPARHWEADLKSSQILSRKAQFDLAKSYFVPTPSNPLALYSVEYYNSLWNFVSALEGEFRQGRLTPQHVENHLVYFLQILRERGHSMSLLPLIKMAEFSGNPGLVHRIIGFMDSNRVHIREKVLLSTIRTLERMQSAPLDIRMFPEITRWVSKNHQIATKIISSRRQYLKSNDTSKEIYNLLLPHFELFFDSKVLQILGLPVSDVSDGSKLEPDVVIITTMLTSYFEQCEYEEGVVRATYNRFNKALSFPDIQKNLTGKGPGVFNVFIKAFAMLQNIDIDVCLSIIGDINRLVTGADKVLTVNNVPVRKRHAGADRYACSMLLQALSWGGHLKAAEKVLSQIWRQYPAAFDIASNVVISGYVKIGDEARVLELMNLRELVGYATDKYTKRALAWEDEALLGAPPFAGMVSESR